MILVDYSPVITAAACVAFTGRDRVEMNVDTLRIMTLNSLKLYRKKFKLQYGELVLCIDSGNSWRRDLFPYYKARRVDARAESPMDWDSLYKYMGIIEEEIKEYFPYKVIRVPRCEADDIIAILAKRFAGENPFDRNLIISGDKDFRQLQVYGNVDQWSNVQKKMIVENYPEEYLKSHIIRGDTGDGVPNMLSPDDTFVTKKRQKVLTEGRMQYYTSVALEDLSESERRGYDRNKILVDLIHEIPKEYEDAINKEFDDVKVAPSNRVMTYLAKNRMRSLIEEIQEFTR